MSVAREKGAVPLFITPLERRNFDEDHIHLRKSAHLPYVEAYYRAAEKYGVPLIDLYRESRRFIEKEGDEPTKKYFMHVKKGEVFWLPEGLSTDNTHLRYEGAMKFGELVARELVRYGEPFASLIDGNVLNGLDAGYEKDQ